MESKSSFQLDIKLNSDDYDYAHASHIISLPGMPRIRLGRRMRVNTNLWRDAVLSVLIHMNKGRRNWVKLEA